MENKITFDFIPVAAVRDCKWNGTREASESLVANIASMGVLQPIGVRKDGNTYNLVFGARRLDAAKKAALGVIPALVYGTDISDEHAVEMTLAENMDRLDQNPVQESRMFAYLKKGGMSESEIAARVGKSEKLVRGRLKLADLDAEVAKQIDWSEVKIACVEMLATLPASEQRTIFDTRPYLLVEPEEMRCEILGIGDLSRGKFDVADATLIPEVGSCVECPKRTGAEKLLFDDKSFESDHCLDGTCFREKCDAALSRAISKLREKNPTAICVHDASIYDPENHAAYAMHEAREVNGRDLEFCKKGDAGAKVAIDLSRGVPSKACYVRAPDKSASEDKRQNRPTTPEEKVEMLGKRRLAWAAERVQKAVYAASGFHKKHTGAESLARLAAAFGPYGAKPDMMAAKMPDVAKAIFSQAQQTAARWVAVDSVTDLDRTELEMRLTLMLDLLTGNGAKELVKLAKDAEEAIPVPKTLARELEAK